MIICDLKKMWEISMMYDNLPKNYPNIPPIGEMEIFFLRRSMDGEFIRWVTDALITEGYSHPWTEFHAIPESTMREGKSDWDYVSDDLMKTNGGDIFIAHDRSFIQYGRLFPNGGALGELKDFELGSITIGEPTDVGVSDYHYLKHHSRILFHLVQNLPEPVFGYVGNCGGIREAYERELDQEVDPDTMALDRDLMKGIIPFFGVVNYMCSDLWESCPVDADSFPEYELLDVPGKGIIIWLKPEFFDDRFKIERRIWNDIGIDWYPW